MGFLLTIHGLTEVLSDGLGDWSNMLIARIWVEEGDEDDAA
jgi:hypothetical protein